MSSLGFKKRYYFRPSNWVVGITLFVLAVIGFMVVRIFEPHQSVWYIVPSLLFVALFVILFLRTPIYTEITEDTIRIQRIVGSKNFTNIIRIQRIDRRDLDGMIRTFGNGGFFGYTGYFRSPTFGGFYMMAVNMTELALVTLESGKVYVINYPSEDRM